MNQLDFTHPGGFRMSQEKHAFMQNAYKQMMAWAGGGQDIILSGVVLAGGNISNGWVLIGGELLEFVGGAGTGSSQIGVVETTQDVTYFDGTVRPSVKIRKAGIVVSGGVPYNILTNLRFESFLGIRSAKSWNSIAISLPSFGNYSGTVYWRINELTRMLEVKGEINSASAQSIPDPAIYIVMCDFPINAFILDDTTQFTALYRYHNSEIADAINGSTLIAVNGELSKTADSGTISIGWRKPEVGVNSYAVSFYFQAPLILP